MIHIFISIFAMLFLESIVSAQTIPMVTRWVSGVTDQWKDVNFGQNIANPIVVAGPLSYANAHPAGVRIRNVTSTGLQVRAQEWNNQDGVHSSERLSYLVMKRGRYVLGNGTLVLAASTSVRGGGFQSKTFSRDVVTNQAARSSAVIPTPTS